MSAAVIAHRATQWDARRHFDSGGSVLVSEYGHELTRPVTAQTVTHNRQTITWGELVACVREWRGRYPNQRFYVIGDGGAA